MEIEDLVYMLKLNGLNTIRNIPSLISYKNLFYTQLSNFGSFVGSEKSFDSLAILHHQEYSTHISTIQLRYIDKIIELAKNSKTNLVFLTVPVHSSHHSRYKKGIDLKRFADKKKLVYLDYSRFIMENNCFADGFHLNKKGAQIFTDTVCKLLEQKEFFK
jgi:hypothetical protein